MKTKDMSGVVDSVEAPKDATGQKGAKGTKRKQGWKGWVVLEEPDEPVQDVEIKAHSNSSQLSHGDDSNARRKSTRSKCH